MLTEQQLTDPPVGVGADKLVASAAAAIADIPTGASLVVGGFGLCGIPQSLIRALHEATATELNIVSNNCGIDDWGLGILLADRRISRMTSSYVGENSTFARQFLSGELEVELCPQGTLAERLRAGGAGIPAFYTPAGVGTQIAEGGLPWRYRADDTDGDGKPLEIAVASPPKEVREFGGRQFVLEEGIVADFALVRAVKGDRHGNLVYARSARNFNPLCAAAGAVTIAEVEELVEPGELDPDEVHTPGIFVQRVVGPVGATDKRIERRTVHPRS